MGGCLGVLFWILAAPLFRARYAWRAAVPRGDGDHGSAGHGEKGGSQAKLLLQATAISGVYDFFVTTPVGVSGFVRAGDPRLREGADRGQLRRDQLHPRLGYGMGCAALILCAGGVLSNLVLVPLGMIGATIRRRSIRDQPISAMTAAQIFAGTCGSWEWERSRRRDLIVNRCASWWRVSSGDEGVSRARRRAGSGRRDLPIVTILIGVIVSADRGVLANLSHARW